MVFGKFKASLKTCKNADIIIAKQLACSLTKQVPKLLPWSFPLGIFAGWLIWPALSNNFKSSLGLPTSAAPIVSSIEFEEEEVGQNPVVKN